MKWISGKWHAIWAAYHARVIERMETPEYGKKSPLRQHHYDRFNHHYNLCCSVKGKGTHAA
ncbi:hypothetical protein PP175_08155 [Aneurinibacillus sp. Ricciae_BoGa-3]|uniref:hypothetical protein n=1 Tax=Aneurinibacillus sp. Ricciae_BoGa-3 TaxID=3022697 RepID=UPI002341CB9B|nr:hypothetical protein [Aneurinibacillus sp. Ricciae_BoGa-3]WCK55882.1 hypothetical protein PP175_08155 [Aneurinibacillus sp. Ricciae_BoGa-3]